LTVDTTQRLTVEQVLLHPWLCKDAPMTPLASPAVFGDVVSTLSSLAAYITRYL